PLGYHEYKIEIIGDLPRLFEFSSYDLRKAISLKIPKKESTNIYRQLLSTIDYYNEHTKRLESIRNEMLLEWTVIVDKIRDLTAQLRADMFDTVYDIRENHVDGAKEKYLKPFNQILVAYI